MVAHAVNDFRDFQSYRRENHGNYESAGLRTYFAVPVTRILLGSYAILHSPFSRRPLKLIFPFHGTCQSEIWSHLRLCFALWIVMLSGGHYCNLTIDNRIINRRLRCMYSGIYGPRSIFSVCCPPLIMLHFIDVQSCKNRIYERRVLLMYKNGEHFILLRSSKTQKNVSQHKNKYFRLNIFDYFEEKSESFPVYQPA